MRPGNHFADEEIRSLLTDAVSSGAVPGTSLLLAHRDGVIFREAFGWADIEAARPFTVDQPVWLGSGTVPISATCVIRLSEQGRLDLDAPIQQYLPEFRGTRLNGGISPSALPTTRQLLSHTSGVVATAAWAVFWEPKGAFDPNRAPPTAAVFDQRVLATALTHSLAEAARRTAHYHLIADPGTRFAYSGAAFSVAGRVAEVAAGRPFDELVQQLVLEPLGMSATSFRPSPDRIASMPVIYAAGPSGHRPVPPLASTDGGARLIVVSDGLAGTLDDVARFLQAHLEDGRLGGVSLISEDAARDMRTDHTAGVEAFNDGRGYGLGWYIDRTSPTGEALTISHGGALGCTLWIDLDRELIGALFTQVQPPTPAVRELTRQIQQRVRDSIAPTPRSRERE